MQGRVFLFSLLILIILVVVTSPPVVGPLLRPEPTPTATPVSLTPTPTATTTPDPFAGIPTATPLAGRAGIVLYTLPTPALGALPPTFTPTPPPLPIPTGSLPATLPPKFSSPSGTEEVIPTPSAGLPPAMLHIPRLQLAAPIEPVSLVQSESGVEVITPTLPAGEVVSWLGSSAGLGMEDNIVLLGRDGQGEIFQDLAGLEPGDEIWLYAGAVGQAQLYVVKEVLILEGGSSPEARLAQTRYPLQDAKRYPLRDVKRYLQPTGADQLTLVGGRPEGSVHQVVIALPIN